jgi:hypothetical protein
MTTNYRYGEGMVEVEASGTTVVDNGGIVLVMFGSVVEEAGVDVVVVVDCIHRLVAQSFNCRTMNVVRVLYPDTVRWMPSWMNRLGPFGEKCLSQSAIRRLGQRNVAFLNSLLKRTPRERQSGRVWENSRLSHKTGLP